MNIVDKISLKARIEFKFLMEQKWGIKRPSDPFSIPKFVLKKYLPADPVVIDCGAHIGADSVELAKIFPKAIIHSFEPVPDIFKQLKHNTRKFRNISCHKLALSDKTGRATMFVSSGSSNASSSLLEPTGHKNDHPDVYFENKIEVETITLDEWAEKRQLSKIDFMWLDMQGFEYQMLQASSKILPHVKAIHTEVSMREAYGESLIYSDYRKWLECHGFEVVYEAIPEKVDMGNALFVKR